MSNVSSMNYRKDVHYGKKMGITDLISLSLNSMSNINVLPPAPDHHPVEQRETPTQSQQMASDACPPHCDRRQEEGESQSPLTAHTEARPDV